MWLLRICRRESVASSLWRIRIPKGLLAVATGNKSELACGYSTIYGDAVGGYAPIKDLLKTRVWEISRRATRLPPKAWALVGLHVVGNEQGRWHCVAGWCDDPRQLDRESAVRRVTPRAEGFRFAAGIRAARPSAGDYIEHAHGRDDLLADGFDEATVDTVMRLVDRAEWKRRQYPLGPKVTALAFGRDRRLPITNAFRE